MKDDNVVIFPPGMLYVYQINKDGTQGEELWRGECGESKIEFNEETDKDVLNGFDGVSVSSGLETSFETYEEYGIISPEALRYLLGDSERIQVCYI